MDLEEIKVSMSMNEYNKLHENNQELLVTNITTKNILRNILKEYDIITEDANSYSGTYSAYLVSPNDILYSLFKLYGFHIRDKVGDN